jgi:hypothetical protein
MKTFIVAGDINSSYKILTEHSINFILLTVARSLAIHAEHCFISNGKCLSEQARMLCSAFITYVLIFSVTSARR